MLSLRDKKPFAPGAPRVKLTLMGFHLYPGESVICAPLRSAARKHICHLPFPRRVPDRLSTRLQNLPARDPSQVRNPRIRNTVATPSKCGRSLEKRVESNPSRSNEIGFILPRTFFTSLGFRAAALTSTNTSPGAGSGRGISSIFSSFNEPVLSKRSAFMVSNPDVETADFAHFAHPEEV
jgi:hypothetical protein